MSLLGFFSYDLERVRTAVGEIEKVSRGAVTSTGTLRRSKQGIVFAKGGLFDEAIFGDGGWGHVEVPGLVHPVVIVEANKALGIEALDVECEPAERPAALAALLRARDPDHPVLALCAITKVPVPPVAMRPLVRDLAPTMVDPWIGSVNIAWLSLVERAIRERRLRELDTAPQDLLRDEAIELQRLFMEVFEASEPAKPLIPPLVHPQPGSTKLRPMRAPLGVEHARARTSLARWTGRATILNVTTSPTSPCGVTSTHVF